MKLKLLLLFVLVLARSSFAGWGPYWPITSNNIAQYYTNAINDLLEANAERYRMNYAMCGNVDQWNPLVWLPGGGYAPVNPERNILIPYTSDLGGYTVVTNGGTVTVTANQTNLYATNNVAMGNQVSSMSLSCWSIGQMDSAHYGLKAFDLQFKKIIQYPVYFGQAAYWLDWTKASNDLYATYFNTPIITNTWSWNGTLWTVSTTTSYPSSFPKFNYLEDYFNAVPETNAHPIYKIFYANSGAPRPQLGWEAGQYTNYYANPSNYVPNRITNSPGQGIFCSLIALKESATNLHIAQATYGLKNWKTAFINEYPIKFSLELTNLPYSKLASQFIYNSNMTYGIPIPTNTPIVSTNDGIVVTNWVVLPANFIFQGYCLQVYDSTYEPYMTTNWVPWYRQAEGITGYPTNIAVSNYTDWVLVGRPFNGFLTDAQARLTYPTYTLTKYVGAVPPVDLSQTYISSYSEDKWKLTVVNKNSGAYREYYLRYGESNGLFRVYVVPKNTTGYGTYCGACWLDVSADETIDEVGWKFTSPSGGSIGSGWWGQPDFNAMWFFEQYIGPFFDPALQSTDNCRIRYVPNNTNLPIVVSNFTLTGTEFVPIGTDSNGWETPYFYRTGTTDVNVSTSWGHLTNIFLDFYTISNSAYDRIITNLHTTAFFAETNDWDYIGDALDFYFDAPGDLYGSRNDDAAGSGVPNWNEPITPEMLNGRKERLINATKYYYSPGYFGTVEKREINSTNSHFEIGQGSLQAALHPELLDGYWASAFANMYAEFNGDMNSSNAFAESPSLNGALVYSRTDSERIYFDAWNGTHYGYRDVAVADINYNYRYPVKTRIPAFYWSYPGNLTAGVKRVVTYGSKGTFSYSGINWTNYVAAHGAATTNWLDYLSWSYPGNYCLVKEYQSSVSYTHTNGLTYISSGYGPSTFGNDIYSDIYTFNGTPSWSYYQNWKSDVPPFDHYGTNDMLYVGQHRGSGVSIRWTSPSLLGFVEPNFVYGE